MFQLALKAELPWSSIKGVSPFGDLRVKGCLPPYRSLSQAATSFVVFLCQGIHRILLLRSSHTFVAKSVMSSKLDIDSQINCIKFESLIIFSFDVFDYLSIQFWKIGSKIKSERNKKPPAGGHKRRGVILVAAHDWFFESLRIVSSFVKLLSIIRILKNLSSV